MSWNLARRQARAEAVNLAEGRSDLTQGKVTLAQVFSLYLEHKSPRKKTDGERKTDERRAEMWTRFLGGKTDPHKVTLAKWEEFIDTRLSGRINARGEIADEPKAIGVRTVESNLTWLRWVFNWAVMWPTSNGGHLMQDNPVRSFTIPTERNPRRPVASHGRYEKIRAVTDRFSYLSELFDLVAETGRRISAVCQLRYSDLRLDDGTPFGSIHWSGETDKVGRETLAPLSQIARSAIDCILRERPGIGDAYLFPSPKDPSKPISRHLAAKWLRRAEKLAGVEPLKGSLWHTYVESGSPRGSIILTWTWPLRGAGRLPRR